VPLVKTKVYLTNWLNEHPTWHTSVNPPLWVNSFNGEELEDPGAFRKKLKRIAKRAGVTKKIHPHVIRHTKLTDCVRTRAMTESSLRWFAGWSPTSNMPALYVHLSGIHMEGDALRASGIEVPDKKPMFDKVKICPLCGIENELHAVYCVTCSSLLDGEKFVREETKKMADLLTANEGMLEQLVNLLKQPHA